MQFSRLSQLSSYQVNTIYHLPFIQELASNHLPIEKFHYYLQQDIFYLKAYAQALSMIASRLEDKRHKDLLNEFVFNTLHGENKLHNEFFQAGSFNLLHPKSAVCDAYCRHLLWHASKSDQAIALASVLPCFWLYHKVGQYVNIIASKPNRYMSWINIYCNKDFCVAVNSMMSLLDALSIGIDDKMHYKVESAFLDSVAFEKKFWEDAYSFCVADSSHE